MFLSVRRRSTNQLVMDVTVGLKVMKLLAQPWCMKMLYIWCFLEKRRNEFGDVSLVSDEMGEDNDNR